MTSAIRARREAEDGFTLIELLVVVIIIGILAAIAIPAFLNQRERAWQAELTSTARNVALEIEASATAVGGTYNDADALPDQAALEGFATEIQNAAATPVVFTLGDTSTTAFCFTAQQVDLGTGAGEPNIAYDSDTGGLTDYEDDGSAAC